MLQGFFFFFSHVKQDNNEETVTDFICLPRMCCALKYVLLTTISPLLSSYSLLSPPVLVPTDPTAFSTWQGVGYLFSVPVFFLEHRQIFCQQCCFFGSALLSLQLTFHLLELLSPLNEVKHTVWFYSCCLHKGGILTTYMTQRGFVSASVGMVSL